MPGIHDCGGNAAAYVLGALDPAEAEAFRRHLEECAACRDEVDSLGGAVDALPMSAPQYRAPKRARRRLMRAVRAEPRPGTRPRRRVIAGRWGGSPRIALAALAGAAVLAAVVIGAIGLSGGGGPRIIAARVTGVSGAAELRVAHGRGELIVRHLSPPPPGHVYEVWLKSPSAPPVPASVLFSVGASGGAQVGLPGSLTGISQVMVTPEPVGGSRMPTHSPVIVASLT